jgi:hypothetical protein
MKFKMFLVLSALALTLQSTTNAADLLDDTKRDDLQRRSLAPLTCSVRGATCISNCYEFGTTQRCNQYYCDGAAWRYNGTCLTSLDCPPNQCPRR